jgi:hypothetical protein
MKNVLVENTTGGVLVYSGEEVLSDVVSLRQKHPCVVDVHIGTDPDRTVLFFITKRAEQSDRDALMADLEAFNNGSGGV